MDPWYILNGAFTVHEIVRLHAFTTIQTIHVKLTSNHLGCIIWPRALTTHALSNAQLAHTMEHPCSDWSQQCWSNMTWISVISGTPWIQKPQRIHKKKHVSRITGEIPCWCGIRAYVSRSIICVWSCLSKSSQLTMVRLLALLADRGSGIPVGSIYIIAYHCPVCTWLRFLSFV